MTSPDRLLGRGRGLERGGGLAGGGRGRLDGADRAGGGSVVVGATGLDGSRADGSGGLVGLVGLVGRVGRGFAGRAAMADPWAPGTVGAIPGAGCGPGSMVTADDPVLALEDAGPVGRRETVVGGGNGGTPEDLAGSSGMNTVEATIAAATAKVSPKATSIRRQGGRCSARWRGLCPD